MSPVVYNDKKSNFNELLVKDGSVYIHHQNSQKLAVEMFKVSSILSLHLVLAHNTKDISIRLGFFNKKLFYGMTTFYFISLYEVTCNMLLCKFLVVRWP